MDGSSISDRETFQEGTGRARTYPAYLPRAMDSSEMSRIDLTIAWTCADAILSMRITVRRQRSIHAWIPRTPTMTSGLAKLSCTYGDQHEREVSRIEEGRTRISALTVSPSGKR